MLGPREAALQWRQVGSEGQLRLIPCDRYAGDALSDKAMVQVTVVSVQLQ